VWVRELAQGWNLQQVQELAQEKAQGWVLVLFQGWGLEWVRVLVQNWDQVLDLLWVQG